MNLKLVDSTEASAVAVFGTCRRTYKPGPSWIILDEMDKFDGMERPIAIAVGMDAIINNVPGEAGAEVPEVRSRMYRAITRANMMVLVAFLFLTCKLGLLHW